MNQKSKIMIFTMVLSILLVGVGAISAADADASSSNNIVTSTDSAQSDVTTSSIVKTNDIQTAKAVETTNDKVSFEVNGETLKEGDNVVTATVNDDNTQYSDDIVATISKDKNLPVKTANTTTKPKATVNVITTGVIAKGGDTLSLNVVVSDENNTMINGGTLIFKLNGETIKVNGTNLVAKVVKGIGSVDYKLPDGISAKNITLTAVYSSGSFNRSEGNGTIMVERTNVHIDAPIIKTNSSKTVINASILDTNNNFVIGKNQVAVKVNGRTVVKSATVDSGKIAIEIDTSFADGVYDIQLVTGLNNRYNSVRMNTVLVKG